MAPGGRVLPDQEELRNESHIFAGNMHASLSPETSFWDVGCWACARRPMWITDSQPSQQSKANKQLWVQQAVGTAQ